MLEDLIVSNVDWEYLVQTGLLESEWMLLVPLSPSSFSSTFSSCFTFASSESLQRSLSGHSTGVRLDCLVFRVHSVLCSASCWHQPQQPLSGTNRCIYFKCGRLKFHPVTLNVVSLLRTTQDLCSYHFLCIQIQLISQKLQFFSPNWLFYDDVLNMLPAVELSEATKGQHWRPSGFDLAAVILVYYGDLLNCTCPLWKYRIVNLLWAYVEMCRHIILPPPVRPIFTWKYKHHHSIKSPRVILLFSYSIWQQQSIFHSILHYSEYYTPGL